MQENKKEIPSSIRASNIWGFCNHVLTQVHLKGIKSLDTKTMDPDSLYDMCEKYVDYINNFYPNE